MNLQKTNIVIFCKSGKKFNTKFVYNNVEIEHATSYKYLGILYSSSGTFTHCQNDLYKRALKAYFKLSKCFEDIHRNVDTLLHLFDHTVKPVALYGSEIWGTINSSSKSVAKDKYDLFKSLDVLPCEKLHIKFLKYILGVHKKSSNDAVKGELGRYPLYFEALCSTVKYLQRLQQEDVSDLLKDALWESKSLYNCHKKSWFSDVQFLIKLLGINDNSSVKSVNIVKCVKNKLIEQYKYKWACTLDKCAVDRSGKLRTYALFKKRMCREAYLSVVKDFKIRRCVTSLRISSHKLEIEAGRYKKVESNMRFCKLCVNSNLIEDEVHFMIDCDSYRNERTQLYESLSKLCMNFNNLNSEQKFVWMFSNEDSIVINEVSKYIYTCYNKRFDILKNTT